MIINTQAAYTNAKAALESLGFSGFPAPSSIDYTAAVPVNLNINMSHKVLTSTNTGDTINPVT